MPADAPEPKLKDDDEGALVPKSEAVGAVGAVMGGKLDELGVKALFARLVVGLALIFRAAIWAAFCICGLSLMVKPGKSLATTATQSRRLGEHWASLVRCKGEMAMAM